MDRNYWWVEGDRFFYYVALRKESVDRNKIRIAPIDGVIRSLSARRAWIEIFLLAEKRPYLDVALRKESVDRNSCWLLA